MRRLDGFTLTELLVVISIIALLLAALLPSLAKARKAAQAASCMSNQRQIGMALHAYANQFDGWFPLAQLAPPPFPGGSGQWFHTISAMEFLPVNTMDEDRGDATVLHCRASTVRRNGLHDPRYGQYTANIHLFGRHTNTADNPGTPLHRITHASQRITIMDGGYYYVAQPRALSPIPNQGRYIPGASINHDSIWTTTDAAPYAADALAERHSGKTINILFADSHVQTLPAEQLVADAQADDKHMWMEP